MSLKSEIEGLTRDQFRRYWRYRLMGLKLRQALDLAKRLVKPGGVGK